MLIAQASRMNMPQQQMNFPGGGPHQNGGFPMQNMFPGMNMPPEMMGMGMPPHMGGGFGPGGMPMGGPMNAFGPGMDANGGGMPNGMGMPGPSGMMQQQQMPQQQQQQQAQQMQQFQQSQPIPSGMDQMQPGEILEGVQPSEDGSVPQVSPSLSLISRRKFNNQLLYIKEHSTPVPQQAMPQQGAPIQTFSADHSPVPAAQVPRAPGGLRGGFRGGMRGGPPRPFGGGVPLGPTGPRGVC